MIELDDAPPPSDDQHRRVADLVQLYVDQVAAVASLESALKSAVAVLQQTETTDLPTALLAVGYLPPTKAVIAGYEVKFSEKYRCGQLDDAPDDGKKRPLEDRLRGLQWLDDEGHGDVAKRSVTVTLGAGTEELANELETMLRSHRAANSFMVEQRRLVPWGTLAALTRRLHELREDPPLADLGVAVLKVAEVK